MDPQIGSMMRGYSREHMARIWRAGADGESLPLEEELLYKAMLDHPEYRDVWENAAALGNRDVTVKGTNPFLHVALHCVVEHQVALNTPPEVAQTLFRLMLKIPDRHDAVTMIMGVLVTLIQESTTQNKPFDIATYVRRLKTLKTDR